jgi:hypothetical protein
MVLAMKMVQVTSEAKASPIITAFTMTSADMNITQGDSSFITGAVDFSERLPVSPEAAAGTAGAVAAAGAAVSDAGAAGAAAVGAAGAAIAGAGAGLAD